MQKVILGAIVSLFGFVNPVLAQSVIVPDGTLGNERSVVIPNFNNVPVEAITGGARRGQNLFHSFSQFNVGEGRSAYFFLPDPVIQNVFARVTGSSRSEILGTLGIRNFVNGTLSNSSSNLYLMNPNGILFGINARLDVGGSFVATTANSIQFENTGLFSASKPTSSSLLSIAPSALSFTTQQAKPIVSRAGLAVPQGQSLVLVGGDVQIEGGALQALGGRVELGGLAASGNVVLGLGSDGLKLNFLEDFPQANVTLNQSGINVRSASGGDISIYGRNLSIINGSNIGAGLTASNIGNPPTGDIKLVATDSIQLSNLSRVQNDITSGGEGISGKVIIRAKSLTIDGGSTISSSIFGKGSVGGITINTNDITMSDFSVIGSIIGEGSSGNSGGIDITNINQLFMTQGAEIQSLVSPSTNPDKLTTGNSGVIKIATNKLLLTESAINSSNFGSGGNAGDIILTIQDSVVITGSNTFIASSISPIGGGVGGKITISTGNLAIVNGAQIQSRVLDNNPLSKPKKSTSGDIDITARENIQLIGIKDNRASQINSSLGGFATGNAGRIYLEAKSISLLNGAVINASSTGFGEAGDVLINADKNVTVDGFGELLIGGVSYILPSGISTSNSFKLDKTTDDQRADSGEIRIQTSSLDIKNRGFITSSTLADGMGGNIYIKANKFISLDNLAQIRSNVDPNASGKGGDVIIQSEDISILNSSSIFSGSIGQGPGGDIKILANTLKLDKNSIIFAGTDSTDGGNLDLTINSLLTLRNKSSVSTSAGTSQSGGNGGNITFNGGFIVAIPKEDSDITANAFSGRGGQVIINSPGIFGLKFRPKLTEFSDITASSEGGINGTVRLNTPDNGGIQNGLNQLPKSAIDTEKLVSQTCIVRKDQPQGTFYILGKTNLPQRPGDLIPSNYSTQETQTQTANRPWQKGDPIVEPQGFYKLANGRLVMSRECDRSL